MKKVSLKVGPFLIFAALGSVIASLLFSGYLYNQNNSYQSENRKLIIQNDSILSVNIELKKALQHKASLSVMNPLLNCNKKH
jgi:hypothetical protein